MMAKRTKNSEGAPSKRAKIEDIDDLWGDDLDESVIDDCFQLATQVIEQKNITCTQLNNVSILPSYNAFKGQRNLFSSTQSAPALNNGQRAATSTFTRKNSLPSVVSNSDDYDVKLKKLQEQILTKDGEVSILRSQLNALKTRYESENARKQKEWVKTLNEKTKEIETIQSKLEFKDLEIINLKQKNTEIIKAKNLNLSLSCTHEIIKQKQNLEQNDKSTLKENSTIPKLQPVVEKHRPLQQLIPLCIFTVAKPEKYFIRNNRSDRPPSLCHTPLSQFVSEENDSAATLVHNMNLNLSCIFSEIGTLLNSTITEIEHSEVINTIFNFSLALLHTFLIHIKRIEQNCRTEDLIHADVVYLGLKSLRVSDVSVFDGREMCENEMGINLRQSIALIAEVLSFNSKLRDGLNEMVTVDSEWVLKFSGRYLEMLIECITFIGKLRLSPVCVGVLYAVIKLLTSLEKCCYEKFMDVVDLLFKEIVLSRPEINVLLELSYFLKATSHNAAFVTKLCTMQSQNTLKFNVKEGYFTYNQNTCLFHIISILYQNCLDQIKGDLLIKMSENFLCFLHNAITQNSPWLYYNEQKSCECLYMVIKLSTEIVISCLNHYEQQKHTNKSEFLNLKYSQTFSTGARLLHIINIRLCAFMEKYITTFARFMDTVKRLYECRSEMKWEEGMCKLLENIILMDEEDSDVNITSESFNSLPFWDQ